MIGRLRSFRPVAAAHSDQPLQSPTTQSTCRRSQYGQYGPCCIVAVRSARPHSAWRNVARVGLLGAGALRAAVLRRDFNRSPPRALAAAARRRALAPRRPSRTRPRSPLRRPASGTRGRLARAAWRWSACAPSGRWWRCTETSRSTRRRRSRPASSAPQVPPPPLRRVVTQAAAGSPCGRPPAAGRARRSARPAAARAGGRSPRAALPVLIKQQRPTHFDCRVERALVFRKVARSAPAQPPTPLMEWPPASLSASGVAVQLRAAKPCRAHLRRDSVGRTVARSPSVHPTIQSAIIIREPERTRSPVRECMCVRACARMCAHVWAQASECVCACGYLHVCGGTCVRACVGACARAFVRSCARKCVRACVRACVRVREFVYVRMCVGAGM
jgi:hypothetical protein